MLAAGRIPRRPPPRSRIPAAKPGPAREQFGGLLVLGRVGRGRPCSTRMNDEHLADIFAIFQLSPGPTF
jgi:hypothetical protein